MQGRLQEKLAPGTFGKHRLQWQAKLGILVGMPESNALAKRLVDHYGGRVEAAEAMKVSPEAIRLWLTYGIPLSRSIHVERKSKKVVTAEEILREKKRAIA
jgi:hypothetical protein